MKSSEMVKKAINEIGVSEYPANSNNVKYNTWFYGKEVQGASYPWCCAFISWLFKNDRDLCKRTASCQDLLSWFEKQKQTFTDKSKAQAGDLVFFKYATNARRTNHIGMVVGKDGNKISTVEGNTSVTSNDNGGAVMQRLRSSNIVAFARPNYDDAYMVVQKGSKGVFVRKLQTLLNVRYGNKLEVDGDFGSLTEQALISAQAQLGIKKTGKCTEDVWIKILRL